MFNFLRDRDDYGFTQRCGRIRMDSLRHNPYVGSFSHSRIRSNNKSSVNNVIENQMLLGNKNPLIGTFRHAPPASNSTPLGLKSILFEDRKAPHISQLILSREIKNQRKFKKALISMLSLSRFSKDDLTDSPQCAICLELFMDGDEFRSLSCAHCYHKDCIDEWLVNKTTCPLCCQVPNLGLSGHQSGSSDNGSIGLIIDEYENQTEIEEFLASLDISNPSSPVMDTLKSISLCDRDDNESDELSVLSGDSDDSWLILHLNRKVLNKSRSSHSSNDNVVPESVISQNNPKSTALDDNPSMFLIEDHVSIAI